jgi:hypothetical protein
MFALIRCDQLREAVFNGRADDILALLAEGANMEFKYEVHSLCLVSMRSLSIYFALMMKALMLREGRSAEHGLSFFSGSF